MPIPRYEREEEETASSEFTRAYFRLFRIAVVTGTVLALLIMLFAYLVYADTPTPVQRTPLWNTWRI